MNNFRITITTYGVAIKFYVRSFAHLALYGYYNKDVAAIGSIATVWRPLQNLSELSVTEPAFDHFKSIILQYRHIISSPKSILML